MQLLELKEFALATIRKISNEVTEISKTRSLGDELKTTGASGDSTKFADEFNELVIQEILGEYVRLHPEEHLILITEETGLVELGNINSENGFFIILDPIDGSNNIRAWRTPSPAVSIGMAIGSLNRLSKHDNFDAVELALAMDIFNNRIFISELDGKSEVIDFGEIQTSPEIDLTKSLVGISFDYTQEKYEQIYNTVEKIMKSKKCQRRLGSSILDFCKVACGEYDSFISLGGKMGFYDLAGVKMIIENAGGKFEILSGKTDFCIIKRILETKNASLLAEHKYEVLASGNETLHNIINEQMVA